MSPITDARGVEIAPGDVCLYGFGVGRSVAMAEGVVLGDTTHVDGADVDACPGCPDGPHQTVSLTASGRVRIRIIRRSYGDGDKPVVDVAPDRLVVLKRARKGFRGAVLPPSPLPTQDEARQAEARRQEIENLIEVWTANLRSGEVPDSWKMHHPGTALADYHVWCADQLVELRRDLKALEAEETP